MADEISPTSSTSETPTPRTTGGNGAWEPPSPAELQALMPGYTIEKLLGRGGMGAVYKGVQENLDRTVAIKILPPGVEKEDPSFAERFKNEARLMAKLMHSSVVGVFDFGSTSAGQLYIVMEYVDGTDVSQMIRSQKKLPPEHALAITAHVCDALAAAHELGIVHRDIKPANVLINMKGQVKVADFGLAKIDDPGSHGLTKTGYAMGTPDFVAPEALMLGTAVDGRADLYAVGVMLYQMLTGQIPRGAWQPASVLSPGTDVRFDQIILKAMQYDREARYQSSAELRQDLDIILTVPMVKQDAPAAAVVPAAEVAQVPAQRSAAQKPSPQSRSGVATTRPAAGGTASDGRAKATPVQQPKSKTPLFIGLGVAAVIGIGAFVMRGGKNDAKPSGPLSPLSGTSAPATNETAQGTVGTTLPPPAKAAEPPKHAFATITPPQSRTASTQTKTNSPSAKLSSSPAPTTQSDAAHWQPIFPEASLIDGAIILPTGKSLVAPDGVRFHNGAIRVVLRRKEINQELLVRLRDDGDYRYALSIGKLGIGSLKLLKQYQTQSGGLFDLPPPNAQDEYHVEFVAVDDVLGVFINGHQVAALKDTGQKEGGVAFFGDGTRIRDPQWQSFDVARPIASTPPKTEQPSAAATSPPTLPPELTVLDDQLKKLTAERVTAVFDADVAKLSNGYLGGLDRKIAEEKAAGHLDGVLALNAEKTLIQGFAQGVGTSLSSASRGQDGPAPCPLPADDDKTAAVLKTLRAIYRDTYAKLVAAHAANLKALTDPLSLRLQQLEADLTKKDRIADAQTVRGYREKLGGRADGPPSAAVTPQTALGGPSALPTTSVIAIKDGFANSLGMKFVPVPGTDVVMCIHETRRQDYAAYAADAAGVDAVWKDFLHQGLPVGNEDNHPVAGVSWDDAVAFCAWLSQKEGRAYRLPTDQEWSYAVGIGREEKGIKNTTPELLSQQVKNQWPWGDNFPPKTKDKAGNYADMTRKQKLPALPAFDAYTDEFVTTAPVMSFTPNKLGIYDLGGNMWEWVADWYSAAQTERTLRGSAFGESANFGLLSSYRHHAPPTTRGVLGFRVVVGLKAPAAKPAATLPAQTLTPTKPSGLSPFPLPLPKRPTEAGKLVMWRLDGQPMEAPAGVTALPTDLTDVVDIALGWDVGLALRSDGSVVSWGKADAKMLTQKPADLTDVVDLDSGGSTALALQANGKVSCWPGSNIDEPMPDVAPAVAIDYQGGTVLALRNDGRVFQWGESIVRQKLKLEVPAGLERVIAISNGHTWACALRDDGRLTAWGRQQEEGPYQGPANSQLPKPDRSARRVYAVSDGPCGYLVGEKGEVEEFGRQLGHVSLRNLQPKVRRISQVLCAFELSRMVFRDEKNQWHFLGHATKGPNEISAMNVPYCEKMAQDAIQIVISRSHALAIKPKDAQEPK